MWFERTSTSGKLLPGLNRGARLSAWPTAAPLAVEMHPALIGNGYEIIEDQGALVAMEDLELYLANDPLDLMAAFPPSPPGRLPMLAVFNDRQNKTVRAIWRGSVGLDGRVSSTDPTVSRRGHSEPRLLGDLLTEFPPTLYFLNGTTVIGGNIYEGARNPVAFNPAEVVEHSWTGVDITAETDRTATDRGAGQRSVQAELTTWLNGRTGRGTHRWVLFNDGPGEIADLVVIERLQSGEIVLGLWHAKGAADAAPGLRVNEMQVVVAQAIRSRRWVQSLQLWPELASRIQGTSNPHAVQVGGDNPLYLRQLLGLDPHPDEQFRSWIALRPPVRAEIGVVQPGLSKRLLVAQIAARDQTGILDLLDVLSDTAMADGGTLMVVASP